jgi:hypothetical protein
MKLFSPMYRKSLYAALVYVKRLTLKRSPEEMHKPRLCMWHDPFPIAMVDVSITHSAGGEHAHSSEL